MTKAKCRELYKQMDQAIDAFQEALDALSGRTMKGIDERGKYIIEYHGQIKDGERFVDLPNSELFLMDAYEALEQIKED